MDANGGNVNADEQGRRTIGLYTAPTPDFYGHSIAVPAIGANNFELKPQLITLICDTVKTNGVNSEIYKLMLFPFAKLTKLRVDVQTFRQKDGESLYEAWERFKLMIRKCPPDMFLEWTRLQIFYDGLSEMAKMSLDNSAGGSLHMKTMPEEANELRNPMNTGTTQKKGVLEVDTLDAILAQNKIMSQQISMISQQLTGMQVSGVNTQETSYDMTRSYNQGDAYGYAQPTREQGWRNHLNFRWREQPQKPQQSFNNNQGGTNQNSFMQETRGSIQNLEIQGQLSKRIPERPPNTLSNNTEVNPREECKALIMGKEAEPKEVHAAEELKEEKTQAEARSTMLHAPLVTQKPEVQHPQKLQEDTKEEQFTQFLEIFKKLHINISFAEVLEKMPPYMACLKSALSEKKALKGDETVVLTKEGSVLVQRRLSKKMPHPGSFLIPCTIGTITFQKALCDLGSSINLMPLSVMRKLGIQEAQPTKIALEMADKS
ncbi:uncharacterized protein LOC107627542 [Arachis ipaensis]|uniref:uncharacterized protein LOC107627542 n=1 Tax=Arachis ipaensis TaxID=130454 RepID=UPI0007AF9F65|nr:uncharacterized protein LOC107627542 [Arachis ipaensis]XP_025636186.1 uncharacterized protein LOC112730308 [Arachis hypogaea]